MAELACWDLTMMLRCFCLLLRPYASPGATKLNESELPLVGILNLLRKKGGCYRRENRCNM